MRVEWEVIVQQEKKIESVHPGGSIDDNIEENKGSVSGGGRK